MNSLKLKFLGDKKFYLMLIGVVLPIILQQFLTQFVSLLDNLMIGNIGNSEMTGVSLGNQLLFVFNLSIFGSLSGASIFASQYMGANDKKGYHQAFKFKCFVGIFFFILFTVIFILFNEPLIKFFINSNGDDFSDPNIVLQSGKQYLLIMLFGNLPFVIKEIYATSLREMKETKVPMLCGVIAIIVNLIFNTLLIFGLLGFPKLGVAGAAIATVISRVVEMIIIIIYTTVKKKKYVLLDGVFKSEGLKYTYVKKFIPKTLALVINETLWSLGLTLILSCYALKGLDVVASLNICNTVSNLFITIGTSMGNATAIIIGTLLGAKKLKEAKAASYKIMFFAFCVSLIFALIELSSAFIIPNIYDTSDYIKTMSTNLIIIAAIILPFSSISTVCYFTLRSGGMMLVTILFDSCFIMLVRLPLAFILTKYCDLSIYTIYFIVTAVDAAKIFVGIYLINKGIWIRIIV